MPQDCVVNLTAANTLLHDQASLLREEIQKDYMYTGVYGNTIKGETHKGQGQGSQIITLVANRVSTAWSRTAPEFTPTRQTCGTLPEQDEFGQTQYVTELESLQGMSPKICVNQAYHLVKNSLIEAASSMKQAVTELMEYDIRNQYLTRSGVKYVANSTVSFFSRLSGGRKQVATPFPNLMPDSPMSIVELQRIISHGKTVFGSQLFGSGADAHAIVVVGPEQAEILRQEALTRGTILSQTNGGYMEGNNSIKSLLWENFQHFGFRLNIDNEPLRTNAMDGGTGLPVFVEPGVSVASDSGFDYVVNPDWTFADAEVGFVIFKDAFKRLVPERYAGEGPWKFHPQFTMGELQWFNERSPNCNLWGDEGFFIYKVTRAFQAWHPHAVIPILYKRCEITDSLTPCDSIISS